ncbi:SpaA isopeptide-forming pilin-related protein [Lactiplantibacillus dongliensis]|uniref:SpaA isopeptide-forming pilin-related protein n=1 Tax=Lactiplantibacillus dongliensis TaxID=2559919 RepID=A0ABW1R2C4_9LACO|nr:SpaA isopeptide-forming pilin-related protein [Lactiplantibacillus dongliensis]
MRLKTILAGTATLLTLMAANTVKAQAASQSTTATSDADTTATSSATTTKQVVTLHNSSADSSGGSNDTSNGTTANNSSSTSSSSASSSSVSSSSVSSSSVSSSASSSSNSSSDDSSSSTPSASASSSSTPAPVSPVKADSTVKDATPDTTVSDVSSAANPAASELNQQQLLVQSQAKSTSATLANSQLATQMYNAAVTSQKGSLFASNLATGILPFASFKMLLAKSALPVNGIDADDIVSITDTNGKTYTASDVLSAYASYTAVYNWSIADGVDIADGATATITLPDSLRFPSKVISFAIMMNGNQVGTVTTDKDATTATMTFNSYFADHQLDSRHGTVQFSTAGTDTTAGDDNYKINKVGWIDSSNPDQLYWNIVINPNGETWNKVKITDELGLYQTLNTNSVTVETVDTAGKHTTTADYTLTVNGNVLTFDFSQIKTEINLYYTVVMDPGHLYTNSAKVAYTPAAGTDPDGSGTTTPGDGGNPSTGTDDNQETAQSNPALSFDGSATADGTVYGVLITKTDAADTTKVLAGAMYDLYDGTGTTLMQPGLTTDKNGQISISHLAAGDYVLKETNAPTGYLLSTTPVSFTVSADTATITAAGNTTATIVPVKVTDKAIEQTTLDVTKVWSQVPTDVTTPAVTVTLWANGVATSQTLSLSSANNYQGTFSNLDKTDANGTDIKYTVVESTLAGYVSTQSTTGNQVTITNTYQTGTINIVKTGSDTKTGLSGATFALVDDSGNTVASGTTDSQGKLTFTGLKQGSYTLKETSVPTGYQFVADQAVTFDDTQGYTANLAITDPVIEKTTVKVTKAWVAPAGVTTPAVTVMLYINGVASDQTLTLSSANNYQGAFSNLDATDAHGTTIKYTVSEINVPDGYTSTQTTVGNQVTITNTYRTGTINIAKTGSDTKTGLSGATFVLVDQDGQTVASGTTDANGQLSLTGLLQGTYTLKETSAPAGYQFVDDQTVTVNSGNGYTANLAVIDPVIEKTAVNVTKTWVTPASVKTPAVTVTLQAGGVTTGQTLTLSSANNYQGTFSNLDATDAHGKTIIYTVVETVPTGYTSAQTGTDQVTITNTYQTGTINIVKTGSDTKTGLSGATFVVVDGSGQAVATGTTDSQGQLTFTGLLQGTYTLKEASAPAGYQFVDAQTVTVNSGNKYTANLAITDPVIEKTTVNVTKAWVIPAGVTTPAVTVTLYINGVTSDQTLTLSSANNYQGTFSNLDATDAHGKTIIYKVVETVPTGYTSAQTTDGHQVTITNTYQTGTITIVKTGSDTKTALAGATFTLVDGNGQIVKTGTTDNQGQLAFTDLNQGSYTLKETNAPAGYQLVADQTITVDYTNGYAANLAITDPVIPMTTITVNKHWANTQGKVVTSPVTMTLSANGKAVQTLILTAETGYTGQFTNLAMTTADGTPIVYTVSETPVAGYTMSGGQLVDGVVDFTNTLQTGSLTITKVDSQTQTALAGATFDLRDANGQLVQTGTTDVQGRLTFTGLVSGTYTLHEATAPTGYQLAADQMVTVDATSAKAAGITVADVAVPVIVVPPTTTITVNKHWVQVPASTTTPSVTVTLVANGTLTDQTLTLTAANGYTGQFTNLAVNDANDQAMTYTVVETPIAGYTTTGGNVVNGVADITNTWVKVPVIPIPTGSLQVIKVDATTKHRLAGAAFDLRDVSGNLVASGVTAENGQVMFNNLTYGTYQVVETTAPAGYDLNTKPQLVTIGETTMQSITVADTATVVPPVKPVVPVTPATPTKPEQPRQPTTPTIPTKPVVPVKPEQPGYPDVVTVTVTPDQPAGVTFGEYYGGITPKQPQLTTVTKSSTDWPTVVTTTVTASAATVMPTKTATPKVAHQQLPQTNDATALWLKLLGLIGLLLSGLSYARFKRLD